MRSLTHKIREFTLFQPGARHPYIGGRRRPLAYLKLVSLRKSKHGEPQPQDTCSRSAHANAA